MTVTEAEWDARAAEREAAAAGDPDAWRSLFAWLWPWTVRVAGSEDNAMAGWLNVVRRPAVWLTPLRYFAKVFVNAGHDEDKKERRHRRRIAALCAAVSHASGGANQNQQTELMYAIKQALAKLPSEDREVMGLYLEEDLTIAQISAIIAVSETTVRRRLRMAIAAIRDVLRRKDGAGGLPASAAQGWRLDTTRR